MESKVKSNMSKSAHLSPLKMESLTLYQTC